MRQGNEHHLPTTAVKIHVTYELNCLFVYNADPNLARSVTIMIYFPCNISIPIYYLTIAVRLKALDSKLLTWVIVEGNKTCVKISQL